MSEEVKISGEEREVSFLGGASIDGAPISYIVVLAAVATALAFVPFSVVLASGGSFPLSQAVYPLIGVILGPLAGALASGLGALIGVFVAPHTAGVPFVSVLGAVLSSYVAGTIVKNDNPRKFWWIFMSALFVIANVYTIWRAVSLNGVPIKFPLLVGISGYICLILYSIPFTRDLISRGLKSRHALWFPLSMFATSWISSSLNMEVQGAITYTLFNWPTEVWAMIIPIVPTEGAFRALAGMVIGVAVIAGLRSIGLTKSTHAQY